MIDYGDTVLAPYPEVECLWPAIVGENPKENKWLREDGFVWCKFIHSDFRVWMPRDKVIPFDSFNAGMARPESPAPKYDIALQLAKQRVATRANEAEANLAKRKNVSQGAEIEAEQALSDFDELSDDSSLSSLKVVHQGASSNPNETDTINPVSTKRRRIDEFQQHVVEPVNEVEESDVREANAEENSHQSGAKRSTSITPNPKLSECYERIASFRNSVHADYELPNADTNMEEKQEEEVEDAGINQGYIFRAGATRDADASGTQSHGNTVPSVDNVQATDYLETNSTSVTHPKRFPRMRTRADVKKDLKTVRETVVGAQDENDAGDDLDEEESATTEDEDVELRSGMVALATSGRYPHWPCILDRALRPNHTSVPLEDATACWVYYLNGYKADIVKRPNIIPYTSANVKMAREKADGMSKRMYRDLSTLPGAFDEAEDRISKAAAFSPPDDAASDGPITLGTVVLARIDAFPPWPAIISKCDDGEEKELQGEWKVFDNGELKVFCRFLDGKKNWTELACVWKYSKQRAHQIPLRKSNKLYNSFVSSCKKADQELEKQGIM